VGYKLGLEGAFVFFQKNFNLVKFCHLVKKRACTGPIAFFGKKIAQSLHICKGKRSYEIIFDL
jgi:hypothetical protein